ncbi:MAG: arabinan endo-1,5-alpha-L-arabinosidase [Verrucomicrobiaceae bacterium]|nr:arabinan endo-1,5-alpha-L-arabinosidase [Verrucomicrobiaceae bacterium]
MKSIKSIICLLLGITATSLSAKMLERERGYSGNPVIDGWYADPQIRIYEGKYWIFPTTSGLFKNQVFFDCFSSPDLVTWTKHQRIIDNKELKWVNSCLWAPDSIEKDGKYYLFFSGNDAYPIDRKGGDMTVRKTTDKKYGGIGVAVADKPEGPYKDLIGKPLIDKFWNIAQPIDQYVFKYKNQWYMIYGGWRKCNLVQLADDFKSLKPFPDGSMYKDMTPQGYVEGSVMFERKGKWYFMWSEGNWTKGTYKVAYGIADTPFGPFERLGAVLENDENVATGAGHHSVFNYPNTDDWYICYHRRPIPNYHRDHRMTCIDRLYFDKDGKIKPVKMTFKGVKARTLK